MSRKVNALEMWIYNTMLRIRLTWEIVNDILTRINKNKEIKDTIKSRNPLHLGHIMRNKSILSVEPVTYHTTYLIWSPVKGCFMCFIANKCWSVNAICDFKDCHKKILLLDGGTNWMIILSKEIGHLWGKEDGWLP